MNPSNQPLPHDPDAERAMIGAGLMRASAVEHFEPTHFFEANHQTIARAMRELHDENHPIDAITVSDRLRTRGELESVGGVAGLFQFASEVPSLDSVPRYAEILRGAYERRTVIAAASQAITQAMSGEASAAEVIAAQDAALATLQAQRRKGGLRHVRAGAGSAFEKVEMLYARKEPLTGLSTSLAELDDMTKGLQRTDLIVLAGRPSMGKSSLAMAFAQEAAIRQNAPTAVFSLEMSTEQLIMRMMSSEGFIEGARIRTGLLKDEDWPKLARAAGMISEAPMWIDDTPAVTLQHIRSELRRLRSEIGDKDIALVVVDYIQLMTSVDPKLSVEQVVSQNSQGLKAIAKEFNCPVVALAQLNRGLEQRQDKRPVLSDLRSSGAIEQDADIVMFVYRDVVYNPDTENPSAAEIIIGKQRNGGIGTARARFDGEHTRFENPDSNDIPPQRE